MKCPYQINKACIQRNTDITCDKCKLYGDGIKPTGGIDFFHNYKKDFNKLEGLILHYYGNMIEGEDKDNFAEFFSIETKRKGNTK